MSTTQLKLYNAALGLCGETTLASLAEEREARYALDEIWNNDAIQTCLEAGQWNFGVRSTQLDYSPSISPNPVGGYQYAFEIPSDWVRWTSICLDPHFEVAFVQYQTDNGFLFADEGTLYVRYVSNDNLFGNDMSLWPKTFCRFVEAYLALYFAAATNKPPQMQAKLQGWYELKLRDAGAKDAQQEPEKSRQPGMWARSRVGSARYNREF